MGEDLFLELIFGYFFNYYLILNNISQSLRCEWHTPFYRLDSILELP